jgi:hypothetical protein
LSPPKAAEPQEDEVPKLGPPGGAPVREKAAPPEDQDAPGLIVEEGSELQPLADEVKVGGDANILADLTRHLVYLETKYNQPLCRGSRKRAISTFVAVGRFLAVPSGKFHKTTHRGRAAFRRA